MGLDLETLWDELESSYSGGEGIYRRLELKQETGIRMAVLSPGQIRAILLELRNDDKTMPLPPKWNGLEFRTIQTEGPSEPITQLCIYVEKPEHRPVFTIFCNDIVRTLERAGGGSRGMHIQQCFNRWARFFEKRLDDGLSPEQQKGLFGELTLLRALIESGFPLVDSVSSWKGYLNQQHDFLNRSTAIEVKTTSSKEPRKVYISSERQLDYGGLNRLYLFIVSVQQNEDKASSLPAIIHTIRQLVEEDTNASFVFESGLIEAGYLDSHASRYRIGFSVKKKEAYSVLDGFPRIISAVPGVGDISYTVTLSACHSYLISEEVMLTAFIQGEFND